MAGINKQDDFQKTALRLPRDLHAQIIDSAKKNGRTMNSEIVERLSSTFSEQREIQSLTVKMLVDLVESKTKKGNDAAKPEAVNEFFIPFTDAEMQKIEVMAKNSGLSVNEFIKHLLAAGSAKLAFPDAFPGNKGV